MKDALSPSAPTLHQPSQAATSPACRIALGCWFRHLQHQSSAEDVRLLERLVRQLDTPAGVDFLHTAFQQHNLPYEEFRFVVMRMRLEIKRQVGCLALSCMFAGMLCTSTCGPVACVEMKRQVGW